MSETSPILSMPYLQPSQAQKHVTHNEALSLLDLVVQLSAVSFADTAPPATPEAGDVYVPAPGATDAWAGHALEIAVWRDDAWQFATPQAGWRAWDQAQSRLMVWDGTAWVASIDLTNNLSQLGISATPDATNVLAVSGAATLLTHGGAGHQLKVNKASAGDTASLLFQSNWTGHAEMGLSGSHDFSIKVSPDGSTWSNAMTVVAADGFTGFGTTLPNSPMHVLSTQNNSICRVESSKPDYSGSMLRIHAIENAAGSFNLAKFTTSSDTQFQFSSEGNGTCDGSWTGGGADYAEFFEWADGNIQAEDRRGLSVVLDGTKIRPALPGEDPIGVISGNPSVVGDGDIGHWKGKHVRDAFGGYIYETVDMMEWQDETGHHSVPPEETAATDVPDHAACVPRQRRCLNPDYVPSATYVPRAERPEWAIVGMVGKLRLRIGQPTGARWVRMRQVTDEVEEWLIR